MSLKYDNPGGFFLHLVSRAPASNDNDSTNQAIFRMLIVFERQPLNPNFARHSFSPR